MSDPRFLGISTNDTSQHDSHNSSTPTPTSPSVAPTRTVAIIKPHAIDHRFEIEHRISEAKFEVTNTLLINRIVLDFSTRVVRAVDREGETDGV